MPDKTIRDLGREIQQTVEVGVNDAKSAVLDTPVSDVVGAAIGIAVLWGLYRLLTPAGHWVWAQVERATDAVLDCIGAGIDAIERAIRSAFRGH